MPFARIRSSAVLRAFIAAPLVVALAWVAPAGAQDAPKGIDAIRVTAQKREENLQEVPLALNAYGEQDMERFVINRTEDISKYSPGLNIVVGTGGNSRGQPYIRGLGQTDFFPGLSSRVGLYIDGMYLGNQTGMLGSLVDLERIEVLRGPQGTLYGRNTIGGAINLISKKPSPEPSAKLQLRAGDYNYLEGRGSINVPLLSETLFARISFQRAARDGFDRNSAPGAGTQDTENLNRMGLRAALRWLISDRLTADYVFQRTRLDEADSGERITATFPGARQAFLNTRISERGDTFYQGYAEPNGDRAQNDLATWFHSLIFTYDVSDTLQLKSTSGWRKTKITTMSDLDGSEANFFATQSHQKQRQFYQEVQAVGTLADGFIDYAVGGTWFEEEYQTEQTNWILGASSPSQFRDVPGDNYSWGAYTQVNAHVTERLTLTGGVRYSKEKKKSSYVVLSMGMLTPEFGFKDRFDNWSPLARASYEWTEDFMTYVQWSRGYQAGGFPARPPANLALIQPFDAEKLNAWEAGLKSSWLDQRLIINVAGYYYDYEDQQVQAFDAVQGGTVITNAGKSRVRGAEVELRAAPIEGLDIILNHAWNYNDFSEFKDSGVDVTRERAPTQSPHRTFSGNVQYSFPPAEFGEVVVSAGFRRVGTNRLGEDRATANSTAGQLQDAQASDAIKAGHYTVYDARLQVNDFLGRDGLWMAVAGENLGDRVYRTTGISGFDGLGWVLNKYGPPRMWWVEVGMSWGED
jgi:iron complex outermembrane receptor protein